jgi:hypothetical protein
MNRQCELCGQPIKHLRSAATKTMHAYCQTVARQGAGAAPHFAARAMPAAEPARAATFAVASLDADLPIEPEKEAPVARQAKKPVPAPASPAKVVDIGIQATPEQVQQIAGEYEMYKIEAERVAAELAKRGEFLKRALLNFPGQRVAVGERELSRVVSITPSFDLEAAKKSKALRPFLKPYIEVVEKFDLKSAQKHLAAEQLAPFVTARETVSLRFLKPGGQGDE